MPFNIDFVPNSKMAGNVEQDSDLTRQRMGASTEIPCNMAIQSVADQQRSARDLF